MLTVRMAVRITVRSWGGCPDTVPGTLPGMTGKKENEMNASAYDYTAQKWVTGADAVPLRREQLNQHLALLESGRGAEYLRFTGSNLTVTQAIAGSRAELAELATLSA